ncbi:MBL fold metallo-hydrolase [Hydrogenophaga sp. MI9]|uniref:MBL fold metallo-hydrolase n=1 Tax=Hydrogenophaga sp. MI9 TaxID=3453719 RepID=UPI003EE8B2DA
MRRGFRLSWSRAALWLTALLWWPSLQAAQECRTLEPVPWRAVVPGVWVWLPPEHGDVTPANGGHVMPVSVLIAGRAAMVIDPGPSQAHGLRLRRSLACRFGARVRWIVNTHAHSENTLANSAFAEDIAAHRVEVLASGPTREGMSLRCPDCLVSLVHRAGERAMAGTQIVLPTRTLSEGELLRVGRLRLRVMRVEHGHTEGDLVLWESRTRVLWAGGLAYQDRVPELAQGQLQGWLPALDRLQALAPRHLISTVWSSSPGDGEPPPALPATRAYLQALREATLRAMDEGVQPQDTGRVALPAFSDWAGYGARHGFNVLRAWRELEPEWMDRLPSTQDVGR